jgi:antitoxin VapB
MSERAKLFKNGGSQAVRLPADCRFPEGQREVSVKRVGRKVVLEPIDEWPAAFSESLGSWNESIERPGQVPISAQRDPFDE